MRRRERSCHPLLDVGDADIDRGDLADEVTREIAGPFALTGGMHGSQHRSRDRRAQRRGRTTRRQVAKQRMQQVDDAKLVAKPRWQGVLRSNVNTVV